MHSRRYPSSTTDLLCNIKEHFVESWSLGDYKAAVENKQFYANISHNLDVSNDSDSIQQIPSQLVESKLYFAGGSSRFMFDFNTDDVIEMINVSVSVSTGVMPYLLNAIGDRSEKVINRLCSCVIDQYGKRSTFIVSKYAATSLAMKEGPELIHRISEATWYFENLLIDGWLLEMWFFASLITDGVKIQHRNGSHCEVWPRTSQIRMIDSAYIPYIPEFPAWFRPRKWNKGSYDAIYFDKAQKQVLFVQITHGHMHSFRIEYFYDLLRALSVSRSAFEIAKLDIAFLVDKEKLHDFFISDVSGEGLLSDFPGWRNGYEKENVKLFGIAVGL
ncbi:hypothetical protein HDU84_009402 [Entophlyctis sp. JEL0112]|nr:hypothetical protein HDU84_009402 [Entophlyctis sp. JEL0112]